MEAAGGNGSTLGTHGPGGEDIVLEREWKAESGVHFRERILCSQRWLQDDNSCHSSHLLYYTAAV